MHKIVVRTCYFLLVIVLTNSMLFGQNAEKHIQRLVGEIDQEWVKDIGKSIPTNQIEYSSRKIHGFKNVSSDARQQALLNKPWFFYKNETGEISSQPEKVEIPHEFDKDRKYNSAWYVSKYTISKVQDKRYFLKLSRVDLLSLVYINGQKCGSHIGAYTPFEIEITDQLISGENVFAFFVYDKSAAVNGDKLITQVGPSYLKAGKQGFNLSGGIDDIPILEVREKSHIKDVFVKTSTRLGELEIDYEISSDTKQSKIAKLSFEILKWPSGEKVKLKIPDVNDQFKSLDVNSVKVKWNNADLWSPDKPNLYVLRATLENSKSTEVFDTRFGFREFWIEGKVFMLNGVPTRLRGESHYHPKMSGIDFHREVFKMQKEVFGLNACRVHAFMPHPDIFLGADEAGILIIDQSAVWSVNGQLYAKGQEELLINLENEYKEWVRRDRNCPSVVIWDVENEMLRFNYELHLPWISKLPGFVTKYDKTRPVNLSGAGWYSPDQDMVSLHMQDNYARIMSDWNKKDTRPLITGEFWVGARADQRLPAAPEIKTVEYRYIEEAATYERNILEMRYFNLSGFMPFRISILGLKQVPGTIVGYNFTPPNKLEKDKRSEAVLSKIRHCLQAETVFFWPRETYTDANKPFERELVICNDGETDGNFELDWKWINQTNNSVKFGLKSGEQKKIDIYLKAPEEVTTIIASLKKNGELVSVDTISITPTKHITTKKSKSLLIYKDEDLANKFNEHGYTAISNKSIPKVSDKVVWVIPGNANNRELEAIKPEILNFLNNGGNMLCLKQEQTPSWFPVRFQFWSASLVNLHTYAAMGWSGLNKDLRYAKYATILASSHPVFEGINTPSLHLWNKFDGRVADDAFARPSTVKKYEQGNWTPLVASATNTQISLAEIQYGKGTLLACQLHVIENIENVQAKILLDNMLGYLSRENQMAQNGKIVLNGNLNASTISKLTGVGEQFTQNNTSDNYMIATDGADINAIKTWASKGGTAIVFSDKVSSKFEGIVTAFKTGNQYVASKVNDHPLLFGISSGNFQETISNGYFSSVPKNAKVLLQGFTGLPNFWKVEEAGPILISIPYEKGEIILSTINFIDGSNPNSKEFLRQILTNMGIAIPYIESDTDVAIIKKTVPITVDGKLNEWLDDMDDKLVSQYVHAQPLYLTSQNTVEGPSAFDLKLSGINYFMWNEQALHIAGVIFSEEKNPTSDIIYNTPKEYSEQVFINKDRFEFTFNAGKFKLTVNGKPDSKVLFKTGLLDSKFMTDATKLQFSYINGGGDITTVPSLVGQTFEAMIPMKLLSEKLKSEVNVLINLSSKGSKLQMPLAASLENEATWLKMKVND